MNWRDTVALIVSLFTFERDQLCGGDSFTVFVRVAKRLNFPKFGG